MLDNPELRSRALETKKIMLISNRTKLWLHTLIVYDPVKLTYPVNLFDQPDFEKLKKEKNVRGRKYFKIIFCRSHYCNLYL